MYLMERSTVLGSKLPLLSPTKRMLLANAMGKFALDKERLLRFTILGTTSNLAEQGM
jgi:hypothetical protein